MTDYDQIQIDYETNLRKSWEHVDPKIPRPHFQEAAQQYAKCRRELDQEFLKEYSALKHFDLQIPSNS